MRSASQTYVAFSGPFAFGSQVQIPFSNVPPRSPDGGFSTLQEIRIRLNLSVNSIVAAGTIGAISLYDYINSMTLSVSGGDGVHGPAIISGSMMRALEAAMAGWDRVRRVSTNSEGTVANNLTNQARTVSLVIPFDRIGAARADFSRTILSLQAGAAQLTINPATAGHTLTLSPSTIRVEFVLGSTRSYIAVPHVRYGYYGIQSLVGGSLPAAAYRCLLLQRYSAVGADPPTAFAIGDITRLDLSVGGQQLIFNGIPEEWVPNQPPFVGTVAAPISQNTFIDNPGDATSFYLKVFPNDGYGQAVTDLPVGQPQYTIGTALTAAQLQWAATTITPLTDADIVSQVTAQGASADQVYSALKAGRFTTLGARGRKPGSEVGGLLPVTVQI